MRHVDEWLATIDIVMAYVEMSRVRGIEARRKIMGIEMEMMHELGVVLAEPISSASARCSLR